MGEVEDRSATGDQSTCFRQSTCRPRFWPQCLCKSLVLLHGDSVQWDWAMFSLGVVGGYKEGIDL